MYVPNLVLALTLTLSKHVLPPGLGFFTFKMGASPSLLPHSLVGGHR